MLPLQLSLIYKDVKMRDISATVKFLKQKYRRDQLREMWEAPEICQAEYEKMKGLRLNGKLDDGRASAIRRETLAGLTRLTRIVQEYPEFDRRDVFTRVLHLYEKMDEITVKEIDEIGNVLLRVNPLISNYRFCPKLIESMFGDVLTKVESTVFVEELKNPLSCKFAIHTNMLQSQINVIETWVVGLCFGMVVTVALSLLWRRRLSDFDIRQGKKTLPALYCTIVTSLGYLLVGIFVTGALSLYATSTLEILTIKANRTDFPLYQVKLGQFAGFIDCASQLYLSAVLLYCAGTFQYLFFIFRYLEIYRGKQPQRYAMVAGILTLIFTASIPINIALDGTYTSQAGVCMIIRPPISYYYPVVTDIVLVIYMTVLITLPLFQTCDFTSDTKTQKLAMVLLITNSIAMGSTLLFNISSGIASLSPYGPMLSSINVTLLCTCSCFPYFMFGQPPSTSSGKTSTFTACSRSLSQMSKKGSMVASMSAKDDTFIDATSHQTLNVTMDGVVVGGVSEEIISGGETSFNP
ncbi:hypothetical protein HDU76_007232 [Blyttiomyces sp. JEL0837]|nr:hypothetical protein HDU76_007232 [Blyttiomyces sp. JEL0837]